MRFLLACALLLSLSYQASAQQLTGSAPKLAAALSTTVITVKGAKGTFDGIRCGNANAALIFVQVFDVANATTVTLGTTVPKLSIAMSPSVASEFLPPIGVNFGLGIKIAATTTVTGLTAPSTALDCSVIFR